MQVRQVQEGGAQRQDHLATTLEDVVRDLKLLGTKSDSLNIQLDDVQEKMWAISSQHCLGDSGMTLRPTRGTT